MQSNLKYILIATIFVIVGLVFLFTYWDRIQDIAKDFAATINSIGRIEYA